VGWGSAVAGGGADIGIGVDIGKGGVHFGRAEQRRW